MKITVAGEYASPNWSPWSCQFLNASFYGRACCAVLPVEFARVEQWLRLGLAARFDERKPLPAARAGELGMRSRQPLLHVRGSGRKRGDGCLPLALLQGQCANSHLEEVGVRVRSRKRRTNSRGDVIYLLVRLGQTPRFGQHLQAADACGQPVVRCHGGRQLQTFCCGI